MKRDWKFLLGIGTGIFLSAIYAGNLKTGEITLKAEERKITPYKTTQTLVENHRGRDLSFLERRYFFNEDSISEMVFCYPESGEEKDYILFIVKGQNGMQEVVRPESPCAECHPRYKMRLPLAPDARVDVG